MRMRTVLLKDELVKPRLHDTTDCQTGWTTGWMFVYAMQPVVQPIWQRVEEKKERKEVYLYSAFIVATTLKALRRGSHSFTCK